VPPASKRPTALRFRCRKLLAALAAAGALLAAPGVGARCADEEPLDTWTRSQSDPGPGTGADPRATLLALVRDATERSNALGASRLLAEAALLDVEEARAAKALQATATAGLGPGAQSSLGVTETSALQMRAGLTISQLVWDGGRTDRMTEWRSQLAEAARLGALSQREQLALSTVALALERARWRAQVVIYGQYQRKMACLVEALETIVRADRGRASELAQAKKSQQQAEIAMAQAASQVRQVEVRLRRLVGDGLPSTEGLSAVLLRVPPLEELVADVDRSLDLAQLAAQEEAARRYAQAVAAGGSPQVSWSFTGSGSAGIGTGGNVPSLDGRQRNPRSGSLALGLAVNIPLVSPALAPAREASSRRAEAMALQRLDALESRRFRVAEAHEQAQGGLDRARRLGAVLRDSEQVRGFTLQQWQQLGRRSLFDVMGAEAEHYGLRVAYVNALYDVQQFNALMLSLGRGVGEWLR
jgi:outer membrane protein TolC